MACPGFAVDLNRVEVSVLLHMTFVLEAVENDVMQSVLRQRWGQEGADVWG